MRGSLRAGFTRLGYVGAMKSLKKVEATLGRPDTADSRATAPESMFFGRGFEKFALARIGVPRPLKGEKAVEVAIAAGIITPSGKLAKRYR